MVGGVLVVSYAPLWRTMEAKNISTYYLINHGVSSRTVSNLRNGKGITLYTLERLCNILDCAPTDVFEFITDDQSSFS